MNLLQLVRNKLMIMKMTTDYKNKTVGWTNAKYIIGNYWRSQLPKNILHSVLRVEKKIGYASVVFSSI